jgi:hypothetical protein
MADPPEDVTDHVMGRDPGVVGHRYAAVDEMGRTQCQNRVQPVPKSNVEHKQLEASMSGFDFA